MVIFFAKKTFFGRNCFSKMADARRNVRSRFSVADVIAELQFDDDSGDDDLYSGSESDDSENDNFSDKNPPLPPVVLDALAQNDNVENESRHSSASESDMQTDSDSDYAPDSPQGVNSNLTRGRGRGHGRGRGQPRPGTSGIPTRGRSAMRRGRGRGRGILHQNALISEWTDARIEPPNDIPFTGNPGITKDSAGFDICTVV